MIQRMLLLIFIASFKRLSLILIHVKDLEKCVTGKMQWMPIIIIVVLESAYIYSSRNMTNFLLILININAHIIIIFW